MNLANKITVIRVGLIPLFILCLQTYPAWITEHFEAISWLNQYGTYLGTAIFIIASVTDKLDGYVARKYNQITNLGKLLDPLADKLLISAALIIMVQHHQISSVASIIIIGRESIITAIRMVAAAKGVALAADKFGKIKMVLQVIAITAVLMNNYPFEFITSIRVDIILLSIAVLLTLYSGVNYITKNYKLLQLNTESS